MKVSPEIYRDVCRNIMKLYIVASRWIIIDIDLGVGSCAEGLWCSRYVRDLHNP